VVFWNRASTHEKLNIITGRILEVTQRNKSIVTISTIINHPEYPDLARAISPN